MDLIRSNQCVFLPIDSFLEVLFEKYSSAPKDHKDILRLA